MIRRKQNQITRNRDGTAWVILTQGKRTRVDQVDLPLVRSYAWCASERMPGYWYAKARNHTDTPRYVYLHQLLGGSDHRNRDTLDNRRQNLRPATAGENMRNRRKSQSSRSRFKGVVWNAHQQRWRGEIRRAGDRFVGPYTASEEVAAAWYQAMSAKLHGEFGCLDVS